MQVVAAKRRVVVTVEVEVTDDVARQAESLLGELLVRLATEEPEVVREDFYWTNVMPMAEKIMEAQSDTDRDLMWTLRLAAEDFFRAKGLGVWVDADVDGRYDEDGQTLVDELQRLNLL